VQLQVTETEKGIAAAGMGRVRRDRNKSREEQKLRPCIPQKSSSTGIHIRLIQPPRHLPAILTLAFGAAPELSLGDNIRAPDRIEWQGFLTQLSSLPDSQPLAKRSSQPNMDPVLPDKTQASWKAASSFSSSLKLR
ncbi:hypothetical protein DV515_00001397, partial [Chloebia gouldiae]